MSDIAYPIAPAQDFEELKFLVSENLRVLFEEKVGTEIAADFTAAEITQLQNINTSTISTEQWAKLGGLGANVKFIGQYRNYFDAAIASIGTTPTTLIVDQPCTMSAAVTVPTTCSLIIIKPGIIVNGSNALNINGAFPDPGPIQVFSGTGTVSFGDDTVGVSSPMWFGGTGQYNVCVGTNAMLRAGSTVEECTVVGHDALMNAKKDGDASHGRRNTAVGYMSLKTTTTGHENTGVGYVSLYLNTTGEQNVALGYGALMHNTEGSDNVAVGRDAMVWSTKGIQNTALGHEAMQQNTEGNYNVAVGRDACRMNTTGSENVGIGFTALRGNDTGDTNVAIGSAALLSSTYEGSDAIAIGESALRVVTTGNSNIGIGRWAGAGINTGSYNIAIGDGTLIKATTGTDNIAIGRNAGDAITTGVENTIIGGDAGHALVANSGSVFLGYKAGYYETGNNKLFIDNMVRTNEADARAKSLIYGIFSNVANNQKLWLNADIAVRNCGEHADNAAAVLAGHAVGDVYRTGDDLKIVHA